MKYKHYVGILYTQNQVRYVTSIDNETKSAIWAHGKEPKEFTKVRAEDLVFCLACNGIPGVVMRVPEYIELKNDWEVEAE